MTGIIGKVKNFFSGKIVCKRKEKPAQPQGTEEPKPQQQEPKPKAEKSKTEESSPF